MSDRWGIVATIKAPPREVLDFVAYHLDQGAAQIHVFLDNQNPRAEAALAGHPQVSVTRTDGAYWRAGGGKKPAKHQLRQTANATRCYAGVRDLDWLLHIDVDEFVCPSSRPLGELLAALPEDQLCARLMPAEALCSDEVAGLDPTLTYCKAWMPRSPQTTALEQALYPQFGSYLRGGFVSHFIGKILVRTGLPDLEFRIHRAFRDGQEIAAQDKLGAVDLCHVHVPGWQGWQKLMAYRLEKGSYRAELQPARPAASGGMSLHEVFSHLHAEGGAAALRAFFDEVCLARPELLARLEAEGLLRRFRLDLGAKRRKHFPGWRRQC
ncbi:glycosyltransferase family 2 protein [Shimia sp.]|uniref:glycosyltransferase family 2 protein n=1 Tax=Shimia sp. TaxID=1954381 RepID=UPI00356358B1